MRNNSSFSNSATQQLLFDNTSSERNSIAKLTNYTPKKLATATMMITPTLTWQVLLIVYVRLEKRE
jgi:hypothetical protein